MARAYRPPLYVTRSQGSRKWLVDGRELVDYTMGHGALLLGHAHPSLVRAVQEQVSRGTHYGAGHPLEVEWAERIRQLVPSIEETRFTASGTEAAMLAMRVARVATGRDRVVKLFEHFHGWSDLLNLDLGIDGVAHPAAGIPAAVTELTSVVHPDPEAIREALAGRDAAAVILEATGAHYGRIALDAAVVRAIREACTDTGTLLVFDEVVSGFRVAPGGMQSLMGVTPDLTVLGKVMCGGLPGGAVGGRRELMELLATTISHPGTWNANPLSAAAGIATLEVVADGAPQRAADDYAALLAAGWTEELEAAGIPGAVRRLSSIIHVQLDDGDAQSQLSNRMRTHNVDLLHTSAFCSSVHTEEDLQLSVDAFREAIRSPALQAATTRSG
ncbi:MAG TPA: aminotransferase class III-fold pyridoxal phosphate-dependent enzyme [Candidatus Dormibacteraeota bacterium]|nr:aminotransferase class III-fold pyridoxal phosphate-dependent enzyme [Candidatus Dormibacteraeota bacterium]